MTLLTLTEVARQVRRRRETVQAWIEAGELKAVDVRGPGDRSPVYRVRPADLDSFLLERLAAARPLPHRRERLAGGWSPLGLTGTARSVRHG